MLLLEIRLSGRMTSSQ